MAARASGRTGVVERGRDSGGPRTGSPVRPRRRRRRLAGPGGRQHHRYRAVGVFAAQAASSPLTMPRSTAHRTGYCEAAFAERAVVATTAVLDPWSSAWAAKPWAVRVSAMACMAVRSEALAVAGRHLRRPGSAVILADPFCHASAAPAPAAASPPAATGQQVVPPGQKIEGGVVADGPEPLGGRPAPVARRALHGDLDVAPGGQAFQMVTGHVGVEREAGGHLRGSGAGVGADEQVDLLRVGRRKAAVTAVTAAEKWLSASDGGRAIRLSGSADTSCVP